MTYLYAYTLLMTKKVRFIKRIHNFIVLHFWVGSLCCIHDYYKPVFPRGIISVSDIITLIEDLGNQIPDKSWMLYLLEIFNRQNIPAELNLICSFNNDGKFDAIFNGVNQYQFKQITPVVGHSYLRQIVMNSQKQSISYIMKDRNTNQTESFDLYLNTQFAFEGSNHFTGIEWWNKIANFPYPIRYHAEISQLMHGLSDNPSDSQSIVYRPYNTLIPNSDASDIQYPISFQNARIEDGCICYNVMSGSCRTGMKYLSKE
jgi:hypothetical protein